MNPAPVSCLCARRYVGPHSQHLQHLPLKVALAQLSPVEKETRRIAYAIKDPRNVKELAAAAREMAQLLPNDHAVLIPIPASSGSIAANLALAQAIQRERPTLAIIPALRRHAPVESTCARAKVGKPRLTVRQHRMARITYRLPPGLPLYFVDNVTTEGNTLRAAWRCFRQGCGLVFADASPSP